MGTDVRGERRYRSPLRQERAADTRRRIAAAALDLFAEHGFGGTTVTAIAERAGVSAQTVYATFGSKGELLRALLDQMEENADATLWRERIAADPDPRGKLTAFAQWSAGLFASGKAVIAAALGAERPGHPGVAGGSRRSPPGSAGRPGGHAGGQRRAAGRAKPPPGRGPGLDPDRGGALLRGH